MKKELHFNVINEIPRISQWFISLDGEGNSIGEPSLFIRFGGCYSAACNFCDTKGSWGTGPEFPEVGDYELTEKIKEAFSAYTPERVTITGGEPLHYIPELEHTISWLSETTDNTLKYINIESNGNLLSQEHNVSLLVKAFNKIKKTGIKMTLTISPKLDAQSCYNNELSQEDIDRMYMNVFGNVSDYFTHDSVFIKFLFDPSNKKIDQERTKRFICYLVEELDFPQKNIFLMPLSPVGISLGSPKTIRNIWNKTVDETAKKALEFGVRYSPRLQIDTSLD